MKSGSLLLAVVLATALRAGAACIAAEAAFGPLPDIEGVWHNRSGIHIDRFTVVTEADPRAQREFRPARPPYNSGYAAKYQAVLDAHARGTPVNDPTASCLWPGVPRLIWSPYPLEIVISDGGRHVYMLHEYMSQVRRIHVDGRDHPADPEPSYNGHTIGRWEGQTLVMDTVGLREDTMLQNTGMMHSASLRVQERWRLVEPDLLEAEVTMTDPGAFTEPYVTYRLYRRRDDWTINDYVCAENNREVVIDGVTQQRLPQN